MATTTNTIRQRVRTGVVAALKAIALTGFADANIVTRKTPLAKGLKSPCIVVSPGPRATYLPAPAGLRYVRVPVVVSIYFAQDGSGDVDADDQDNVVDSIEAKFQLPPTMPAALVAAVPEAHEVRVQGAEQFLPGAFRYNVDAHRIAIVVDACMTAGVAA
jgi:hypothetical protein